jgi:hypothetical protein
MCTLRVKLESLQEVKGGLINWIRQAYEQAG